MSDFEYRIDSDLESDESSVKGISRYKRDTRYGKFRLKRSNSRRSKNVFKNRLLVVHKVEIRGRKR